MQGDWITFDGAVETLHWGKSTYTILRLPPEVTAQLGPARRVEGEIADHAVNLAVTRAPAVEGAFLWAGQSLLDRIGLMVGERVEVRLRPAPDDKVDLDPDVEAELRAADKLALWQGLTPGKRRGLLYQLATAKTEPTRRKRLLKMIEDLS